MHFFEWLRFFKRFQLNDPECFFKETFSGRRLCIKILYLFLQCDFNLNCMICDTHLFDEQYDNGPCLAINVVTRRENASLVANLHIWHLFFTFIIVIIVLLNHTLIVLEDVLNV